MVGFHDKIKRYDLFSTLYVYMYIVQFIKIGNLLIKSVIITN